jgi:Protein of unknown function (DUF2442)
MPVRKRPQLDRISQEMGIQALKADERVAGVSFSADSLSVTLKDGRVISVPLAWYPKLLHATPEQLRRWKIAGVAMASTGPTWTKT